MGRLGYLGGMASVRSIRPTASAQAARSSRPARATGSGSSSRSARSSRSSRHLALRLSVLLRSVFHKTPFRSRSVMICESCELTGGPFAPGEAAHLLEIHQQLHHGAVFRHRSSLPPRP